MDPEKKVLDSINVAKEAETLALDSAIEQFYVFVHYEDSEEAHPGTIYLGADGSLVLIYSDGREMKG
jgi:hypothetical protein